MRILNYWSALFAAVALTSAPARAEEGSWRRAETPLFIAYSDGFEQPLRATLGDMQEFDAVLRRITDTRAAPSTHKLELYLYRDPARFNAALGGEHGQIYGFYSASPEIVAAHALVTPNGALAGQVVLFHEYAHHFMFQYFTSYYPAWYIEGFAEFVSTTHIEHDQITVGDYLPNRVAELMGRSWAPFDQVLDSRRLAPEDRSIFYAQSWLFVHYCTMDPARSAQLNAYLAALRAPDADPVATFQTSFAMSPEQMQSELRRYLRGPIHMIHFARRPEDRGAAPDVTVAARSLDRLLPLQARLRHGVPENARADFLSDVRSLAARYPGDAFATRTLARAEIEYGAPAAGRTLLQPLSAADSNDVEALYLSGLSLLREARANPAQTSELVVQARRFFVRAARLDQTNVPAFYRFAQSYFSAPGPMPQNALDALVTARNLAPQVGEISVLAGEALIEVSRFNEAVVALRPTASNPHGGSAAVARSLIQTAEAGQAVTFTDDENQAPEQDESGD